MKNTVLVTGASGFIGQSVVRALRKAGYNVRALVRPTSSWPFGEGEGIERVLGDVRDLASLLKAMNGVDWVCHLAAAKSDEKESDAVNVFGAENLCRAAEQSDVRFIMNISSQSTKLPRHGTYARTKAEADSVFAHSKVPVTTLFPSLVYGGKGSGAFSAIIKFSSFPIIPLFGGGKAVYYPIHRDDLAELIVRVAKKEEARGQTYDAGGKEAVSLRTIMERVCEIRGKKPLLVPVPLQLGIIVARLVSFVPKPPLSVSNVLGGGQIAPHDSLPLCDLCEFTPRSFAESLSAAVADVEAPEELDEPTVLMRYIVGSHAPGWAPAEKEKQQYFNALKAHQIDSTHALDTSVCRHPILLGGLDASTRFFSPRCTLQKKLITAASLTECHPVSASWLLPRKRSMSALVGASTAALCKAGAKSLVGASLLLCPPFYKRNAGHC